ARAAAPRSRPASSSRDASSLPPPAAGRQLQLNLPPSIRRHFPLLISICVEHGRRSGACPAVNVNGAVRPPSVSFLIVYRPASTVARVTLPVAPPARTPFSNSFPAVQPPVCPAVTGRRFLP